MKTVLIVLGIVFLVVVVGIAALFMLGHSAGGSGQEKFFAAVNAGDAQAVINLMHPALREQVDEPVLAEWLKAVNANLGKYQGLSATDFNSETKYENGVKTSLSKGAVNFEKGTAKSELKFQDDLLVAFDVTSDKIAPDWFKGPGKTDLYQQQGKKFIELALGGQADKAFEMEHKVIQEQMPLEKFQAVTGRIAKAMGKVKSVEYSSDSATGKDSQISLDILYQVKCEKKTFPAKVRFQFVGLKGHLVAFDLTGDAE